METNLDEFFGTPEPTPEPVAEPVAVEAPPVEVAKGVESAPPARELPPRGEDGKWVKSEQAHMVPLEALLAEREKRQQAERAAAERTPKPDFWENPEAALEARIKASEAHLLEEIEPRAESRARELFLKYTEQSARSRYADYDQMRQVFAEEAQRNPVLATQLREAPDPAEFIYQQGRTSAELREVGGDLNSYRKRIEADVRQKIEREYAEKAALTASIPKSLNVESSKGAGVTGSAWSGPPPIDDILPFKRD